MSRQDEHRREQEVTDTEKEKKLRINYKSLCNKPKEAKRDKFK